MPYKFYEETNFKDTELGPLPQDWEVVRFEDIIEKKAKFKVKKVKQQHYKSYGRFPIVDQGKNLISGYWDNEEDAYEGDLPVIAFGDHTRVIKYIDFKFVCGADGVKIICPNKKRVVPKFFYFSLTNTKIPNRGYNRHFNILKELKFSLPPLSEQKAIAEVLSIVQEAKEKTEAVIKATKELKKSMMKHLFTYGPVPLSETDKVKLKETEIGPIPEHWQVVRLGEVAETFSGGTPRRDIKEYYCGDIKWLKSGELKDNFIFNTEETITLEGLKNSSAKFVDKFTLMIALYGATAGKVGYSLEKLTINQAICAIKPKISEFNSLFYFYFFQKIRANILSMRFGGAQPNLNQQIINNLQIHLPPLPEQQAIASILKTIDDKIQKEEARKQALENLFKSMLSTLMSGRIRVNNKRRQP